MAGVHRLLLVHELSPEQLFDPLGRHSLLPVQVLFLQQLFLSVQVFTLLQLLFGPVHWLGLWQLLLPSPPVQLLFPLQALMVPLQVFTPVQLLFPEQSFCGAGLVHVLSLHVLLPVQV